MTIEGVVFDWGGTLSVWAEVDLEDMWRAAAKHIHPDDPDDLIRRLIEIEARFWKGVEESQSSASLSDVFETATRELGVDIEEAVLEEGLQHHLDSWTPHIAHDPDAGPVLKELREMGLKIGLLSNTLWPRDFHEHFLERDGLIDLIDARLYTSDMARTKPHPSVFHEAMSALGLEDPSKVVMVGDRPFDDIGGAKGAGMRAVLRPNPAITTPPGPEPDATIAALPDLLQVVRRFGA